MCRHCIFTFFILLISITISCKKDKVCPEIIDEGSETLTLPVGTQDTILYANVNGDNVSVYLSIPENCSAKGHACRSSFAWFGWHVAG